MSKELYGYLALGTLIFIIDRVSKIVALSWCKVFFNRGVAWSFLHSHHDYIFVAVSAFILVITLFLCWHAYYQYRLGNTIIGEVCVIAGSLSNIVDRAVYHGVIDFIILSYDHYSWPVFNCADVAIVVGVGIMIFSSRMQ